MKKQNAVVVMEHCNGVDGLAGLFFEAADVERRLPRAIDLRVKTNWPDVPPDPGLAYGYNEVEVRPAPANAGEVERYDWCLQITPAMDAEDARLVWAVAHSAVRRARGPRWALIGRMQGLHAQTVKRRFERAVLELWFKLQHVAAGGCNAR